VEDSGDAVAGDTWNHVAEGHRIRLEALNTDGAVETFQGDETASLQISSGQPLNSWELMHQRPLSYFRQEAWGARDTDTAPHRFEVDTWNMQGEEVHFCSY
jgi:hypothetical protein